MTDDLLKRAEREAAFYDKKPTMFTTGTLLRDLAASVRELEEELRIGRQASEIVGTMAMQQKERAERAEAERDALRAEVERLRGLLADIRAEGRITGGIAKRLIAALAGEREK